MDTSYPQEDLPESQWDNNTEKSKQRTKKGKSAAPAEVSRRNSAGRSGCSGGKCILSLFLWSTTTAESESFKSRNRKSSESRSSDRRCIETQCRNSLLNFFRPCSSSASSLFTAVSPFFRWFAKLPPESVRKELFVIGVSRQTSSTNHSLVIGFWSQIPVSCFSSEKSAEVFPDRSPFEVQELQHDGKPYHKNERVGVH